MPNNFGSDQMDRRVPRSLPELNVPSEDPAPPPPDRRVRSVVGGYRAVIPEGTQKGGRFFTNNSPVVIEKRGKDATGAEKWDLVTSFRKPAPKGIDGDTDYVTDHAIYWLLAGPDAE